MREFTSVYCLYKAPHRTVQKIPVANDVKPFVETYVKVSILLGLYIILDKCKQQQQQTVITLCTYLYMLNFPTKFRLCMLCRVVIN